MNRFMPMLCFTLVAVFFCILMAGCHESGTWQDDARNWKRVFGVEKSADVTVLHSWFWRSPHLTHEFEYYLQVQTNAAFQKRILTMNPMKQVTGEKELQSVTAWPERRPAWFAPKPIAQYEVWIYSNAPASNFRLLIDRETWNLFLTDRQL